MRSLVIIPTYNERDNIARLVPAVLDVSSDLDVLIVDDGSPDGTGELADRLAGACGRVRALHRAGKQGIGSAYVAGFRHGLARGYEHLLEMDADFSHSPRDLPRLIAPVQAGQADLVLGSRWVAGGGTERWPLRRRLLSRAGSLYARSVLGVQVRDLTGGFKVFHRRVLESIDLDAVQTAGYGFQIELTYCALRAGFRVRELPIVFAERTCGVSKMSTQIVIEALLMVWRLRFRQPAILERQEVAA